MRLTDCRYDRDRLRLEIAYRLIGYEVRTETSGSAPSSRPTASAACFAITYATSRSHASGDVAVSHRAR
jgi:hypothetical protein